jgi:hypothetical protein
MFGKRGDGMSLQERSFLRDVASRLWVSQGLRGAWPGREGMIRAYENAASEEAYQAAQRYLEGSEEYAFGKGGGYELTGVQTPPRGVVMHPKASRSRRGLLLWRERVA